MVQSSRRILQIMLIIVVIGTTIVPKSVTETKAQPSWIGDKKEIHTNKMIIRIPHNQPEYYVSTRNINSAGYLMKFMQIIEFEDRNGDNTLNRGDIVLSRGLLCDKSNWRVSVKQNETLLQVNLSSWVRVIHHGPMQGPPKKAFIKIISTIFTRDKFIGNYDIKGQSEVKLDIIIMDWPWRSKQSNLALRILFTSYREEYVNARREVVYQHERDSKRHMDVLALRDPNLNYGVLFKVNQFVYIDKSNGSIVGTSWKSNNTLEIIYPHFNDFLIHDPSLRVIELVNQKIGRIGLFAGLIITLMSVFVSIITLKNFRKKLIKVRTRI